MTATHSQQQSVTTAAECDDWWVVIHAVSHLRHIENHSDSGGSRNSKKGMRNGSPPAGSRGRSPGGVWGQAPRSYGHYATFTTHNKRKLSIKRHIQHDKNRTNLAQEIKLVWSSQSELVDDVLQLWSDPTLPAAVQISHGPLSLVQAAMTCQCQPQSLRHAQCFAFALTLPSRELADDQRF